MKIDELRKTVSAILERFESGLETIETEVQLQTFVSLFTGKKGELTALIRELGVLPSEQRPEAGKLINAAKEAIAAKGKTKLEAVRKRRVASALAAEVIDVTLPGQAPSEGRLHPLKTTADEIVTIFSHMGFDIAEGPEIETDWYNFEALGFPPDHPARQMQATFFIDATEKLLLRTHTSPVQIRRLMDRSRPPPIKVISPGVVYRHDDDPTHSPMFMQVEGFLVDDHTTFADLKGTLMLFLREMFGQDVPVRFRPSFFPFTEPSGEVDIACPSCGRQGRRECVICKGTGWTEILGCGQIDPVVFESVQLDPETYQGYAFGMGVDRIAMFKYGIDSIQHFYRNDPRFLKQF